MRRPISLNQLYNAYEKWVSTHPHLVSDVESIAKWVSYFVAGRMNTSNVITELIYSLSNLLTLFNDRIIHKSLKTSYKADDVSKLKLLLTTLEYCEVFIELSVKEYLGEKAKWIVIVLLQIYKCIGRLVLLYHYKEELVQSPPIPPLQRLKETEIRNEEVSESSLTYTLKRSGRIIRKIDGAPPRHLRTWIPPELSSNKGSSNFKGATLMAETLYVAKPLVHLAAMRCFGTRSWKMWLVALAFDIASLRMYSKIPRKSELSKQQRLELSRRCVMMFMYFMRSPCYENFSEKKVTSTLQAMGRKIPFANSIVTPLLQYLPHWQNTYFYMWSS